MYERHEFGKEGEEKAVEYLKEKGYKIIERNFSCRQGELDVIALDEKYLVFIEIKSRNGIGYGLPSEAVTKKKLEHMIKAIKYYLYVRNLENENIRIDVIEIYKKEKEYKVNHIKQII